MDNEATSADSLDNEATDSAECEPLVGTYVSVMYDREMYIAMVESVSEEFGDYSVSCLHRQKTGKYSFPPDKDICWIPAYNVLCIMTPPKD